MINIEGDILPIQYNRLRKITNTNIHFTKQDLELIVKTKPYQSITIQDYTITVGMRLIIISNYLLFHDHNL